MEMVQSELQFAKKHIDSINEFNNNYKKKAKKERKSSGQEQVGDLLTPTRYKVRKSFSQNDGDSELSSSFCGSEDVNKDNGSEQSKKSLEANKKSRRNSADTAENTLDVSVPGVRTRATSQDNRPRPSSMDAYKETHDQVEEKKEKKAEGEEM